MYKGCLWRFCVSVYVWRVYGEVWGVMGVIKAYRLTKFKIAVEGILKVSEGCLKGVWRVCGGCLGVSGGCLEVSRGCIGV